MKTSQDALVALQGLVATSIARDGKPPFVALSHIAGGLTLSSLDADGQQQQFLVTLTEISGDVVESAEECCGDTAGCDKVREDTPNLPQEDTPSPTLELPVSSES